MFFVSSRDILGSASGVGVHCVWILTEWQVDNNQKNVWKSDKSWEPEKILKFEKNLKFEKIWKSEI